MKRQTIPLRLAAQRLTRLAAYRFTVSRLTALLLVLTAALTGLAACGSPTAQATTMKLAKMLGAVGISDGEGQNVEPAEDLGLYSGYRVDTGMESYAWIDLDSVKLTKLDAESEIQITQKGKALEINVLSGNLFFNITEPLKADETLEIRTSSMLVGIRGTCGWVEVPETDKMNVYLLEGKVECASGAETALVSAGEMAKMSADGGIEVSAFSAGAVPAFVRQELEELQEARGIEELQEAQGTEENDDPAAVIQNLFGTELSEPEHDVFWLRDHPGYTVRHDYSEEGELLSSYEYAYNERGLLMQMSDGRATLEYLYDERDRLTGYLQYVDGQFVGEWHVVENTAERRILEAFNDLYHERYYEFYDEIGRLVRAESHLGEDYASYWEYEYDDQGLLIKGIESSTGEGETHFFYAIYEYN